MSYGCKRIICSPVCYTGTRFVFSGHRVCSSACQCRDVTDPCKTHKKKNLLISFGACTCSANYETRNDMCSTCCAAPATPPHQLAATQLLWHPETILIHAAGHTCAPLSAASMPLHQRTAPTQQKQQSRRACSHHSSAGSGACASRKRCIPSSPAALDQRMHDPNSRILSAVDAAEGANCPQRHRCLCGQPHSAQRQSRTAAPACAWHARGWCHSCTRPGCHSRRLALQPACSAAPAAACHAHGW